MAIPSIKKGDSIEQINAWWDSVHKLYQNDRDGFNEYVSANPEMGIRWHARAANKNVNTGTDNKEHTLAASQLAQDIGYGGKDGKEDGKAIAIDYKMFPDVNNEWGAGDFWKIGTPQTFGGGFNDFIEDNPMALIGAAAALAIPALAPALATSLGVSPAVATGILNAGFTGATGGDLGDIVKSGLLSYGIADAGNLAKKALNLVPDATLAKVHDAIMPTITSGGGNPTGLPEGALSLVGGGLDAASTASGYVPPGGLTGSYGLLNDYDQYNQDINNNPVPPIQEQPAGLPQEPDAGGQEVPPEVVEADEGDLTLGGFTFPTETDAGSGYSGATKGDDEVAKAEKEQMDRYWTNPYQAQGLEVSYTLPSFMRENSDNLDILNRALAGTGAAGQTFSGPAINENYRTQSSTPQAGSGELGLGGSGYLPTGGSGTGTGSGAGAGSAAGAEVTPEASFDFEKLLGLIAPPTQEEEGYDFGGLNFKSHESNLQRPDYGDPTTAYNLNIPDREMQAPMVLPAENAGQDTYEQWENRYAQEQGNTEDILSMIQGKRKDKGLI